MSANPTNDSANRRLRVRHPRHRKWKGIFRGAYPNRRLKVHLNVLDRLYFGLVDTGVNVNMTFDNTTNQVILVSHGLASGSGPYTFRGALPTGLERFVIYYFHVINDDRLTIHHDIKHGVSGEVPLEFTTNGSGDMVYVKDPIWFALVDLMNQTRTADEIEFRTDIDDLIPTVFP